MPYLPKHCLLFFTTLTLLFPPSARSSSQFCGLEWQLPERPNSIKQTHYEDGSLLQSAFQPCNYAGFGFGFSLLSPEEMIDSVTSRSASRFSSLVTLGRQLSPHWSAELMYARLNKASVLAVLDDDSTTVANLNYHLGAIHGRYTFLHHSLPLNVYGKAGLSHITAKGMNASAGLLRKSHSRLSLGAGLLFRPENSAWFVNLDMTYFSSSASLVSIQFNRFFGKPDRLANNKRVYFQSYENNHFRGDADNDQVRDDVDLCPHTLPGVKVNANGCCAESEGCTQIQ